VYFNTNTADWENIMSIVARRNWKTYNVEANMNSMMKIKWDVKFNQFSKKAWVDIDFDLVVSVDSESMDNSEESVVIDMEIPFKWTYKVKNIDKFSLQEPSDAVDLMEMLGGFLWMWMADELLTDDFEWDDEYDYESFEDVQELE
jgi:hypothetical protein